MYPIHSEERNLNDVTDMNMIISTDRNEESREMINN